MLHRMSQDSALSVSGQLSPTRQSNQSLFFLYFFLHFFSQLLFHKAQLDTMGSITALNELDDKRIKIIKPLIPPQILMEDIPLTLKAAQTIVEGRQAAENGIKGQDDRLLVVVGPCSIHDVKAAKEYGAYIHQNVLS